MTPEEQISTLSQLVVQLQEQLAQRDAMIAQLQEQMHRQAEQLRQVQARVDKDSHNSHLPPSSDRFVRQPKSLRRKSGKKPGGQEGHQGQSLKQVASPDQVQIHPVEWCESCQHDLRELTFLHEEQQQEWAGTLKTVLLDLKAAVTQARSEGRSRLHEVEEQDWKAEYQRLLQEGLHAQSQEQEGRSPPDASSKRGHRKHSAAHNLLTRLWQDQEAVLRFVEDFAVPFDNNLAERDVRMVKVQQKVSGCLRSQQGADAFARLRGYLSTLRKQGRALLTALQQAMQGHPVFPSFELAE